MSFYLGEYLPALIHALKEKSQQSTYDLIMQELVKLDEYLEQCEVELDQKEDREHFY